MIVEQRRLKRMGGIILLVLMVLSVAVVITGAVIKRTGTATKDRELISMGDGFKIGGWCFLAFFLFLFGTRSITTVDAGEVKVQVLFGKVLKDQLTEGINLKNPFASTHTYSIRLRGTTMDVKDGNALEARSADKLSVKIDATIWWYVKGEDGSIIYRTIAKDEDDLDDNIVFPAIRTAVRDAAIHYNFDDIVSEKGRLGVAAKTKEYLDKFLKGMGFGIKEVLVRNVVPDDASVTKAIGKKLEQQQQLQAKEYALLIADKDAEIRIRNAHGIAEAQRIIQKTLTPEYLQFERIQMMKTLAHSPNTTFIFDNGGTVPMVFNKDISKK